MERPTVTHTKAVKHIMWYLKGTVYLGLVYTESDDLAGDLVERSTRGMSFYLNDNLIT